MCKRSYVVGRATFFDYLGKDHLDCVLFPDRLTSPLAFGFTDELQSDGRIP
ncbi:hypothetical protein [Prochlorococcus sp. MIT 1011]|uniref:hypothetical protein n=1 Tax=Prochlorococcus sp. MIT 1011 TaxID=3082520 RepID=UPI0039B5E9F7